MAELDEEISEIVTSIFEKYDTDKNGSLDFSEFTLFLRDLIREKNETGEEEYRDPDSLTEAEIREKMALYDIDGNQEITIQEATKVIQSWYDT